MIKLLLASLILTSTPTFAAETLLRCNIPWGELQEVTIKRDGTSYILLQLNNSGSYRSYSMTEKQWLSGKIPLKLSWGDKGVLKKSEEGWVYQSSSEYYVLSCTQR